MHNFRITASNFGKILHRKAKPSETFLASIFEGFNQQIHAASLAYGRKHEEDAKQKYLQYKAHTSTHLHKCGLVINNKFSFLGATPDAKVCEHGTCGILEVKCPYTARNCSIREAATQDRNFCLEQNRDGHLTLKQNHMYCAQVQGQLAVTGAPFCDFVVYTLCDIHVQRILPDYLYINDMLTKLAQFYRQYGKPYINRLSVQHKSTDTGSLQLTCQ
jgi:hypothetical protein